jgi:putative MATE family efflux protein
MGIESTADGDSDIDAKGLFRIIWKFSWPVLGTMLLNFIVGYTDVYVAGLLGPDVQAVVGFISQLYFVLIVLGNALGVGTVALVSRAVGGDDWDSAYHFTRQTMILACILGLSLSALSFTGAGEIVRRFDLPETIRPTALAYLRIFSFAIFSNYIIILMNAVFRAVGRPLTTFKIMSAVTVVNVLANFSLVFGWGPLPVLGYRGIALATVISMAFGAGCTVFVLCRSPWRKMLKGSWRLSREVIRALLKISWPAAVLQIGWNAGSLALYEILGRLGSESVVAMAAYANGLRMEAITYLPTFALNQAAAVLVGQSLGSGSVDRAKRIGWQMAGSGALSLSLFAAFLFWISPQLAGILTSDPGVRAETIRYLRFNLACVPFMVSSVVLGGAMQGAGDTFGVMRIIIFAIWLIRIPLAVLLCFHFRLGALGVWIAMFCSGLLQGLQMVTRFSRGAWFRRANRPAGDSPGQKSP